MNSSVFTVDEYESARHALKLMDKHNVGSIVVTSKGKPVGIITERDVVRRIAKEDLNLSNAVGGLMSQPLISISPSTLITTALHIMVQENIRRLPIVKDDQLIGIIVERDIIRWLMKRPDVILELLSLTKPNVVKEAVMVLLKELGLREKI